MIALLAFLIRDYEFGTAPVLSCSRLHTKDSIYTSAKAPDSNFHGSFKAFSVVIRALQNSLEEVDKAGINNAEASSPIDVYIDWLSIGSLN